MVTMERRVGRLVEVRVQGGAPKSTLRFARIIALANEVGPEAKVVVCADAREAPQLTPDGAAELAKVQLAARARVERAITLVAPRATQVMIHERVRDEGAGRAVVEVARTVEQAVELLRPHLTSAELVRLKQFLDGK